MVWCSSRSGEWSFEDHGSWKIDLSQKLGGHPLRFNTVIFNAVRYLKSIKFLMSPFLTPSMMGDVCL